jgi:hypothetical protein
MVAEDKGPMIKTKRANRQDSGAVPPTSQAYNQTFYVGHTTFSFSVIQCVRKVAVHLDYGR